MAPRKAPRNVACVSCGHRPLDKDTVAVNRKILGRDIEEFYCLDCFSSYLECTVDDILDKIEEFKAEGCDLFS